MILMTFSLLTATDLASSHDFDYAYVYDEVLVSVYNRASDEADPLQGYSYPSSFTTQNLYYQKRCNLDIYTVTSTRTSSGTPCILYPQLSFSLGGDCTFVYSEDNCTTGLLQLAESARRNGRQAVIYRTPLITKSLMSLTNANVSVPVILVKDPDYVIRGYRYQPYRFVNITLIAQTSLPPPSRSQDSGFDDKHRTETIFIVGFIFGALLIISVLVLGLAIFVYHKRHHRRTRPTMTNRVRIISVFLQPSVMLLGGCIPLDACSYN